MPFVVVLEKYDDAVNESLSENFSFIFEPPVDPPFRCCFRSGCGFSPLRRLS
jgi:hypothetical protein